MTNTYKYVVHGFEHRYFLIVSICSHGIRLLIHVFYYKLVLHSFEQMSVNELETLPPCVFRPARSLVDNLQKREFLQRSKVGCFV